MLRQFMIIRPLRPFEFTKVRGISIRKNLQAWTFRYTKKICSPIKQPKSIFYFCQILGFKKRFVFAELLDGFASCGFPVTSVIFRLAASRNAPNARLTFPKQDTPVIALATDARTEQDASTRVSQFFDVHRLALLKLGAS